MIPLVDLVLQYKAIQPEIDAAVQRVLLSGHFILGDEVGALEDEVAAFLGVQHAIGGGAPGPPPAPPAPCRAAPG